MQYRLLIKVLPVSLLVHPRYKRGKKRKKSALPIQFRRRERKTQVESIEVEAANIISNAAYESFKSIVPTPMNELTSLRNSLTTFASPSGKKSM